MTRVPVFPRWRALHRDDKIRVSVRRAANAFQQMASEPRSSSHPCSVPPSSSSSPRASSLHGRLPAPASARCARSPSTRPTSARLFAGIFPKRTFEFVELVERGRRDWLASACRQQVKCDVLVISGHFNGNDFFSDQLQVDEHLPVAEMERASCSDSCPGLFSQLKEVYMFGCDSMNSERMQGMSAEIARTLVNGGHREAKRSGSRRRWSTGMRRATGMSCGACS